MLGEIHQLFNTYRTVCQVLVKIVYISMRFLCFLGKFLLFRKRVIYSWKGGRAFRILSNISCWILDTIIVDKQKMFEADHSKKFRTSEKTKA